MKMNSATHDYRHFVRANGKEKRFSFSSLSSSDSFQSSSSCSLATSLRKYYQRVLTQLQEACTFSWDKTSSFEQKDLLELCDDDMSFINSNLPSASSFTTSSALPSAFPLVNRNNFQSVFQKSDEGNDKGRRGRKESTRYTTHQDLPSSITIKRTSHHHQHNQRYKYFWSYFLNSLFALLWAAGLTLADKDDNKNDESRVNGIPQNILINGNNSTFAEKHNHQHIERFIKASSNIADDNTMNPNSDQDIVMMSRESEKSSVGGAIAGSLSFNNASKFFSTIASIGKVRETGGSGGVTEEDPLAVTVTSGNDERKELTFSRMAATLISSSTGSSYSPTTFPPFLSSLSEKEGIKQSIFVPQVNSDFKTGNPLDSAESSSPYSYSSAVSSRRLGSWLDNMHETVPSSTSTTYAAALSDSKHHSRLPRLMSLVDPQGIKGPISLSSLSPSAAALSGSSLSGASAYSSVGLGGVESSVMIADESERSATTDYNNYFNSNLSDFFGDFNMSRNGTGGEDAGAWHYNYFALFLTIFPLVAMFGNVLVILSVKRERTLWNVTNYFIVSLAVADLLVAAVVMPFAVYILFNGGSSGLPPIFCDFYIATDVTCSTSSILNLVAISIDRFIAVTQPIKYAKHKSNTRVWLTIVFVWVFSGLVGSPIVLGLNTPPDDGQPRDLTECAFHNKYFVLFSSLCSFYIPCVILIYLYYRIFKVIHERAKKAAGGGNRGGGGTSGGATVIENLAQTKRLAETNLSGPSNTGLSVKKKSVGDADGGDEGDDGAGAMDDEKCTNTGSGSQEDEGDEKDLDMDMEGDGEDEDSPNSDDCQIITNTKLASAFVLESVRPEDRGLSCRIEPNGNHDSGYAASNMEEGAHPVMVQEPSPASPKYSLSPNEQCKRNGLSRSQKDGGESSLAQSPGDVSSGSANKKAASRFTLGKVHKASRKKREKSSAKRERKATKTLAIVLGLFLACWLPFFTCNIMDAICSMMEKECSPGLTEFLLTTWLGYVNSCLNPVIYTVFNPEFRKAFKKILGMGP